MAKDNVDDPGCGALQQALKDKNVKMDPNKNPLQTAGVASAYFIEILSSLGMSPCQYLKTTRSTCTLVASNVVDDEDSQTWDWYVMNCPKGPPCLFFENL